MVKIGINGFGRLGRLLLRVAIQKCKEKCASETSRIVMVNDPILNPDSRKHLFSYDTFQGKSNFEVIETGSSLTIEGQRVEFTSESIIERIPWKKCHVDYVIDTTGRNITCEKASMFLTEGIQRVIVPGCSKVPMFIVGVNHSCYDPKMKALSAADPQMNCLMCLLRVLHENFDLQEASATVIHPLNNDDLILDDSREGNIRCSRSSFMSFAPMTSLTDKFVGKIMPELDGKTISSNIKVPVPCVGAIDCTVKFGKEAPREIINCRLKEASESYMKSLMRYSSDELISSDIIGDPHSCIIDSKAGVNLSKCIAKVFAWYDNEFGFANRLYELANYIASREDCRQ